jgi:hypothetical protein
MSQTADRILYCHCAYAQVVPKAVKEEVLQQLTASGVAFDAVADLCEMSAKKDAALRQLSGNESSQSNGCGSGKLKIAACYPRAVKWLFSAADAPLNETGEHQPMILNMRTDTAENVVMALLGEGFTPKEQPKEQP